MMTLSSINANVLFDAGSWLSWICRLPEPWPGFVQGVLPPVFLAVLFLLLPFILQGMLSLDFCDLTRSLT